MIIGDVFGNTGLTPPPLSPKIKTESQKQNEEKAGP
jgi:hypothetical protein